MVNIINKAKEEAESTFMANLNQLSLCHISLSNKILVVSCGLLFPPVRNIIKFPWVRKESKIFHRDLCMGYGYCEQVLKNCWF